MQWKLSLSFGINKRFTAITYIYLFFSRKKLVKPQNLKFYIIFVVIFMEWDRQNTSINFLAKKLSNLGLKQ